MNRKASSYSILDVSWKMFYLFNSILSTNNNNKWASKSPELTKYKKFSFIKMKFDEHNKKNHIHSVKCVFHFRVMQKCPHFIVNISHFLKYSYCHSVCKWSHRITYSLQWDITGYVQYRHNKYLENTHYVNEMNETNEFKKKQ